MFYACIKGFYWTHVSAFLNIFNQFWCWYNTALFDTVTLLIFLVFYWRYKKIIGYDSVLLKKNCDPRNLHCMKLLAASAARIWHARHPFNLLPVKISKGCCHFVPNCYIHDIYMYHKNHSNIPLCSSSSQSSISYFSCTLINKM